MFPLNQSIEWENGTCSPSSMGNFRFRVMKIVIFVVIYSGLIVEYNGFIETIIVVTSV